MNPSGKIYFASDLHLGTPNPQSSQTRERLFVDWLHTIEQDATEIYILGDIFDFWHDYKTVVPRGYVRLLGKLAAMSDAGIPIHIFTGNHDLWMYGYFEQELGVKVYHKPIVKTLYGKTFMIGHGDGLGPNDTGYKLLKRVFTNRINQFLFRWLHPDLGIPLAGYFSYKSRFGHADGQAPEQFLGNEREWLVQYCQRKLSEKHYDYFLFGHRHLPLDIQLNKESRYINTGDWLQYNSYAVFDGTNVELKYFKQP